MAGIQDTATSVANPDTTEDLTLDPDPVRDFGFDLDNIRSLQSIRRSIYQVFMLFFTGNC